MKNTLVGLAVLAVHATLVAQTVVAEDAPRAPLSLRPGAPAQAVPAYARPAEPTSSDPQVQMRDLRHRLELLDRRVAELERRQAPAPSPASDRPEPARLRIAPR